MSAELPCTRCKATVFTSEAVFLELAHDRNRYHREGDLFASDSLGRFPFHVWCARKAIKEKDDAEVEDAASEDDDS